MAKCGLIPRHGIQHGGNRNPPNTALEYNGCTIETDGLGMPVNRLSVVPSNGYRIPGDPKGNLNQGAFAWPFERPLSKLFDEWDGRVEIEVRLEYSPHNATNRPDFINVEYGMRNGDVYTLRFENKRVEFELVQVENTPYVPYVDE